MIDETGKPEWSSSPTENTGSTGTERAGFCQQCGRELTAATVRRAGSAVFCEPCLVQRLEGSPESGAAGYTATGNTGYAAGAGAQATGSAGQVPPPPPPSGTASPIPGEPNPSLAALLGLIPGVGAMYNGQYAKGVAHLVIFAVLVSLADNVNGIFGLLVTGWIFYQAFEAYHTAKARRDGTLLPNPFGLNDIGDRMGFGKNWPGSATRPVSTAPFGWNNGSTAAPNWAGYVPPTNFGATATPPPPPPPAASATAAETPGTPADPNANPWSAAGPAAPPPYSATYAGEPWSPGVPPVPPVPPLPARRFPAGAIWLIGLGVLFLLSNLDTGWHIRGHWLLPIGLAGLAAWMLYHRISWLEQISQLRHEQGGLSAVETRMLINQLRGPVFLLVLAVLFALQAASVFTLGQTWPVLFIVLGLLLILERTAGGGWAGTVDPSVPPASAWPPKEGK